MDSVKHSVVIQRPQDEVFNFVTDFRNDEHWWKAADYTEKITPGPMREGTQFKQISSVLFVKIENLITVTSWNSPELAAYRSKSSQLAYEVRYIFEPVDGGTRYTLDARVTMKGWLQVLKPLALRALGKQLEEYFENLKHYLEEENRQAATS